MGNTLSREEKLLKRAEFTRVSATGKRQHTAHFIVAWEAVDLGRARIGITASRKLGNAVARNRVKRLVREFFRLNKTLFVAADFNIIAKRGAETLNYSLVHEELEKALQCIRNKQCPDGCS